MRVDSVAARRRGLCAVVISGYDETEWPEIAALQTRESLAHRQETPPEGTLLVHAATVEEQGVGFGDRVTAGDLCALLAESAFQRAWSRAGYLLGRQDYAAGAIRRKLALDFGADAAERTVEKLAERGYVNDEALAARLAKSYMTEQHLSKTGTVQKLIGRGIPSAVAKEAAEQVEADPADQLKTLITKKYARALDGTPDDVRRAVNALMRRGFRYGDIRQALSDLRDGVELADEPYGEIDYD